MKTTLKRRSSSQTRVPNEYGSYTRDITTVTTTMLPFIIITARRHHTHRQYHKFEQKIKK